VRDDRYATWEIAPRPYVSIEQHRGKYWKFRMVIGSFDKFEDQPSAAIFMLQTEPPQG
jgi:hypothetical protein